MPVQQTLKSRMAYRIKRSAVPVFVPGDFKDLSDSDQIGRVLRQMVKLKFLIKIGWGVYARAMVSSISGRPIPEKPITELARDALTKMGIKVAPTEYEKAYAQGITTQIPTGRSIGIREGRISRKIGYNGRNVAYERAA